MHGGEIIAIIAVGLPIICGTFIAIISILKGKPSKGKPSKKDRIMGGEETSLIQEMHRGLTSLEDRIESLETLLLDQERTKRNKK